jgi:hypothetical protein
MPQGGAEHSRAWHLLPSSRDRSRRYWGVADEHLPRSPRASAMKLRQGRGTPTFVLVRRGIGAKGHTHLTARDEIEFPSLPSLRILKEFIERRVAAFLEVLIRLQPATSSLLASVVDSDGSFCTFNHARRLIAFMQMQNTFAGIKPNCDVCNPITQTMRLLTPETTRPVHIFLPTRIVATTVRKHDR